MRSRLTALLFLFALITFLSSCGAPEENILVTPPEVISETSQPEADSFLVLSDTISADLTMDYGIFLVDDIDASCTGFLAILDGAGATVTVIDSTGTVTSAGGEGSGPGEFLWPVAVSVSPEGIVAVSDFMLGSVRIYHPGLELYTELGGFTMANPGVMFVTGLEAFTGMRVYFRAEGDDTLIGHQTALWSGMDAEPTLVYTETMRPFSINDFGTSIVSPYPIAFLQVQGLVIELQSDMGRVCSSSDVHSAAFFSEPCFLPHLFLPVFSLFFHMVSLQSRELHLQHCMR